MGRQKSSSIDNIYTLDGKVPLGKSVPFGLQHVLAMFVANIAPIMIAALSLSIGLGFTQVPQLFHVFPDIVRTIFAENCVAVVFITALVLNLVIPKDKKDVPSES